MSSPKDAEEEVQLSDEEEFKSHADLRETKDVNNPGPLTKKGLLSLWIVYFSVFLDFMGISMVQPILPFYAESFGASSTQLGALYSSYSGMALFSAFFVGKGSDLIGRKPMILFSLFGTFVGFLCTGLAQNYWQLLGSRFLTGFFGSSKAVGSAVVTDLVPSETRPKYYAAMGVVFSAAFIVGPAIGSGLSEFGIKIPFFASSGMGAVGFIFGIFVLRESNPIILKKKLMLKNKKNDNINKDQATLSIEQQNSEKDRTLIIDDIDNKIPAQIWLLCMIVIFGTIGWTVFVSMFALYSIDKFGVNTLEVGYVTLCLAINVVFANIVIFSVATKYIGLHKNAIICCILFAVFLCIAPLFDDLWWFLAIIVFGFGLSAGQIMTLMNSIGAEYTNHKNRGTVLSMIDMSQLLALVIGPLLHGMLYEIDIKYPFWFGAVFVFIAAILLIVMMYKWPQYTLKKEDEEDVNIGDRKWEYNPDEVNKKDYMKLGKAFGIMLSQKHYKWVSKMDKLLEGLDVLFPELNIDTEENYQSGIAFMRQRAIQFREEYDAMKYIDVNI